MTSGFLGAIVAGDVPTLQRRARLAPTTPVGRGTSLRTCPSYAASCRCPAPGETAFLNGVLRSEAVGGLLALAAAVVALVWANSPADSAYHSFVVVRRSDRSTSSTGEPTGRSRCSSSSRGWS